MTVRIAGEGPSRDELQRQISGMGLQNIVTLCGSVSDIPGFLSEVDITVQPSRAEGMSNALLEQMASGRAIIATSVGANARLLSHEQSGLLVPPEDPHQLARAIQRFLTNPSLAIRCATHARASVRADHSRQAMVRRFEALYTNLKRRQHQFGA